MQTPIVKEISALSAHRREVELVRWSLVAVPEGAAQRGVQDPADPLRSVKSAARPPRQS
jgi:hypothetical protein